MVAFTTEAALITDIIVTGGTNFAMFRIDSLLQAIHTYFMIHACIFAELSRFTGNNQAHTAILAFHFAAVRAMGNAHFTFATVNIGFKMLITISTMVDIVAFATCRAQEKVVIRIVARLAIGLVDARATIVTMMSPIAATISLLSTTTTVITEVYAHEFN